MSAASPPLAFLSIGLPEMIVIGTVALLVFGGRLPEAMRNLGRSYAKLRHTLHEMTRPIREEMRHLDEGPLSRRPGTPAPPPLPGRPYEPGSPPPSVPEAFTPPITGGAADEPPPV